MNNDEGILSPTPTPGDAGPSDQHAHKSLAQKMLEQPSVVETQKNRTEKHDKTRQNSAVQGDGVAADEEVARKSQTKTSGRRVGRPRRGVERLLDEIVIGTSIRLAAKRAGVSERTAQRRWADPKFMSRVLAIRQQYRGQATGQLSHLMRDAITTLKSALSDESAWAKLNAARMILKFGYEFGCLAEGLARQTNSLAYLKEQLDQNAGGSKDGKLEFDASAPDMPIIKASP